MNCLRLSTMVAISIAWLASGGPYCGANEGAPDAANSAPATVVESDSLELESGPLQNRFNFRDNVRVSGNNITVTCDHLVVVANREPGEPGAVVGELGSIETIVAVGNVLITQAGRRAYAGKAELFPREEKVVLSESPRIVDDGAEVTGWRITLLKGERKARVESDPVSGSERPTVTLEALPDLGFERSEGPESSGLPDGPGTRLEPLPLDGDRAGNPD